MSTAEIQRPNKMTLPLGTNPPIMAAPGVIKSPPAVNDIAIGTNAVSANTWVNGQNVGIGTNSLLKASSALIDTNVAFGKDTLKEIELNVMLSNVAFGYTSTNNQVLTNQNFNTTFGSDTVHHAGEYSNSVSIGTAVMNNCLNRHSGNVVIGSNSSKSSDMGDGRIILGSFSGNLCHSENTIIIGNFSGISMTTGDNNIVIGSEAGNNLTTGADNIIIGAEGIAAVSSTIMLGNPLHTKFFSYAALTPVVSAIPLKINTLDQVGTSGLFMDIGDIGDIGFLKNTKNMQKSKSSNLYKLSVIDFDWLSGERGVGLLAEQVEKYFPEVCNYVKDKLIGVDYEKLLPIIKNEMTEIKSLLSKNKKVIS